MITHAIKALKVILTKLSHSILIIQTLKVIEAYMLFTTCAYSNKNAKLFYLVKIFLI